MHTWKSLLLISLIVASPAVAQMKVVSEGKAIQLRTDELLIHSERIGRDFLVEVARNDPQTPRPGKKYATVYALDGGFGIVGPASRMIIAGGRTVPFYVVSIGYPNEVSRHLGARNTDLAHATAELNGRKVGGGGAAFEAFIQQDLRPYLESRYPLDPDNAVLLGHSGGAMFAATILLQRPESFAGYILGGVPLEYSFTRTYKEDAKAMAHRGAGRRVFLGFSPDDAASLGSSGFGAALSGPGSKFKVREEFFADESHNSEYLMLLTRGLPFVLPTLAAELVATQVDSAVLDRHVGEYRLDAARVLKITRTQDKLFGELNETGPQELHAQSDQRFFSRRFNAIVTFEPAVDGKSPGLLLTMNENDTRAQRVDGGSRP
jgi:predicted alpha/beta superfamily hydrolase